MTFEEAKKILDEELCFVIEKKTDGIPLVPPLKFNKYEKLRVREAIIAMKQLGYDVYYNLDFPAHIYREKMLEREHNELLASGTVEKMVDNRLKEKAEEFSDSVLDELIDGHKSNEKRGKEIARLNKIIHDKNERIRIMSLEHSDMVKKLAKAHADLEVSKVNMQALKSAESALIYKDGEIKEKSESSQYYANKLVDAYHEIRELKERLKKIGSLCNEPIKQEDADYKKLKERAFKEFLEGKQNWTVLTMFDFGDIPFDVFESIVFRK